MSNNLTNDEECLTSICDFCLRPPMRCFQRSQVLFRVSCHCGWEHHPIDWCCILRHGGSSFSCWVIVHRHVRFALLLRRQVTFTLTESYLIGFLLHRPHKSELTTVQYVGQLAGATPRVGSSFPCLLLIPDHMPKCPMTRHWTPHPLHLKEAACPQTNQWSVVPTM